MPRPRKIDVEAALEAALGVFWRKGYEGTSYADLVAATGAERPALYAAFGNKEALFLQALKRYGSNYGSYVWEALGQPTSRQVAAQVLEGAAELSTRFPDRTGCLGLNGALAGSDDAEPARQALIAWRAEGETALIKRFEKAKAEGDLPVDAEPATLAAYLLAVAHGIAVQAKAGFSHEVLLKVVQQALHTWPTGTAT
ncbi:TetR/AcrR family transcriptional regulator [Sphingomonas ginsenosidivorax]|uniref:TetR/AcrR family transcriptional regulator n=1 Tax=Sphingomonas ginsenosidivorax TaxID=862135 RepID=A0A5C6UH59_9SPHN|nr:TetR/AcrR family transcriptional regulator [Sphingomonas ginsenosidivorax]TXC71298.1 TetR/AcrR family transcriptional regulator [Sphingomonas ginsenosidivorax]